MTNAKSLKGDNIKWALLCFFLNIFNLLLGAMLLFQHEKGRKCYKVTPKDVIFYISKNCFFWECTCHNIPYLNNSCPRHSQKQKTQKNKWGVGCIVLVVC